MFFLTSVLPSDEREAVQKKTFTKWVNSILSRVGCRISDLYLDLRDGRMLIKLLEVLSGERLVRSSLVKPYTEFKRSKKVITPLSLVVTLAFIILPCLYSAFLSFCL